MFFFRLTLEYELHLLPPPFPSPSRRCARPPCLGSSTETRCLDYIVKVESGLFIPRVGKCGRPCGRAGQRGRIQEVVVESGGGCPWVSDCNLSLWAMPPATCHKKVYHPKVRSLFQQFLFCSQNPIMHRWQPRHVLQLKVQGTDSFWSKAYTLLTITQPNEPLIGSSAD